MSVLRLALIILGIIFLMISLNAYVRQRLTEEMGLLWGGFALFLILLGVFVGFFNRADKPVVIAGVILLGLLLLVVFFLSTAVSVLIMKNRELAMQVSLLNQENERILHMLGIVTKEIRKNKEDREN